MPRCERSSNTLLCPVGSRDPPVAKAALLPSVTGKWRSSRKRRAQVGRSSTVRAWKTCPAVCVRCSVVSDLAALITVDWPTTLERPGPDAGVDERRWHARHDLIGGRGRWASRCCTGKRPDSETWVPGQLNAGLAALRQRFADDPPWAARAGEALTQHIFMDSWSSERRSAAILAWAAPPICHRVRPG